MSEAKLFKIQKFKWYCNFYQKSNINNNEEEEDDDDSNGELLFERRRHQLAPLLARLKSSSRFSILSFSSSFISKLFICLPWVISFDFFISAYS